MVKAIVDIDKEANRVLNIVKAEYGLKDKSQAINKLARDFGGIVLESQIRPEYVRKLKRIQRQKRIVVGSFSEFKRRYGMK